MIVKMNTIPIRVSAAAASVIEAVRLGEALAAMRDLPMPGLAEMHEATQTVLCNGDAARMTLIREKLEIGEAMGTVPPETPAVPVQRDLEAQQRRLRLPATTEDKQYDFDLRNENGLDLTLTVGLEPRLDLFGPHRAMPFALQDLERVLAGEPGIKFSDIQERIDGLELFGG